jgi:hypothetical protein
MGFNTSISLVVAPLFIGDSFKLLVVKLVTVALVANRLVKAAETAFSVVANKLVKKPVLVVLFVIVA